MELNALKTFFPQCDVGPNCYSTSKNYSKFKEKSLVEEDEKEEGVKRSTCWGPGAGAT